MTLFKPTILVNRLVVTKGSNTVMDIAFHEGLNVIEGENSSGKTTAIRFIAYALGSENINFSPAALHCDQVYLEITANSAVVTLSRHVSAEQMRPLSVFWGGMTAALSAGPSLWEQYPFRRSDSKASFSQVLFGVLDMPELRGEGGSNITMHQLMRLMYSDQETQSSDLFRYDRFDRGITRAAVGDYLLGVDSSELYDLRLQEVATDKEAGSIRTSIRTIYTTFGHSGTNISLEFLENQAMSLGRDIAHLQSRLENIHSDPALKTSSTKEDNALRERLSVAHSSLSRLKQRRFELESEIADSELFLQELEARLFSLEESSVAESHLGTAVFSFCPSCFTKLEPSDESKPTCALCKSEVAGDSARTQLARMKNELSLQLKESEFIRTQQLSELNETVASIPPLEGSLKKLEREFKQNQTQWSSPAQLAIQNLSKEIGAKEQELKNVLELKKLADLLAALSANLSTLEERLEWLKGRIRAVTFEQKNRREVAYSAVAEKLKSLLKSDLLREAAFQNAEEIDIDFGANQMVVDGHKQFSASSMVFLRHSAHLALLLASLEQQFFRYPRFLILDGVEDGGMEVERSYNFQKTIAQLSDSSNVTHQILMTTMSICPDLANDKYRVGRQFTHDNKSIQIAS